MFGYIRPFKPDLRIREHETYKAVYCGLCGQLGKSYGPLARLTLSYDFAFLSMLHYAVSGIEPVFERRSCFVNPLRKLHICASGEVLEYGADVASLMLYFKLLDNIRDTGPARRILWEAAKPFVSAAHKKAAFRQPACEEAIARQMAAQSELEARRCANVDEACEPTALAMAAVCGKLSDDGRRQRVLERVGYLIGRYVYLCDALDDLRGDIKTGSYNPFAIRHQLAPDTGEEELRGVLEQGRSALYLTAGEAAKAYQLLDSAAFAPILDNIFYQGLRAGADEIIIKNSGQLSTI